MTREEAHAASELARLRRDIALVAAQAAMAVCEMDACRRELDEVAAAIDGLQALAKAVGIDSDGCVREAKRRAEATRATYPAAIESVRDDVAAGRWAP